MALQRQTIIKGTALVVPEAYISITSMNIETANSSVMVVISYRESRTSEEPFRYESFMFTLEDLSVDKGDVTMQVVYNKMKTLEEFSGSTDV